MDSYLFGPTMTEQTDNKLRFTRQTSTMLKDLQFTVYSTVPHTSALRISV